MSSGRSDGLADVERQAPDGGSIVSDVFAFGTVAPRCSLNGEDQRGRRVLLHRKEQVIMPRTPKEAPKVYLPLPPPLLPAATPTLVSRPCSYSSETARPSTLGSTAHAKPSPSGPAAASAPGTADSLA